MSRAHGFESDVRRPIPTNGGDWLVRFGQAWKEQVEALRSRFSGAIRAVEMPGEARTDVPILHVERAAVIEVLRQLKEGSGMEYGFLADLTATDETPSSPRFQVVYQLYSPARHWRIRVKTAVEENEPCPTAVGLWPGANWAEREIFDMFGVRFEGHPDLRRILNDVRFEGFPLRKDYPIRGYQVFPSAEAIDERLLSG